MMSQDALAIPADRFDGAGELPVRRIQPVHGLVPLELDELWDYRELLYFLTWRQVKIRYKQTALGIAWAIIQPLFTMLIFSVVFGRFGRVPSDGVPYPVFAFCALLPWQLFSFALTESANSVIADPRLITKVYFPRLIIPMAAICVGLADFAVAFLVLLALMFYYGLLPTVAVLTLPLWTLLAIATALAAGVWLSAVNVRYRDVRYTLPFLSQLWLFATPVAYPLSMVPPQWRPLFALNPMVGVVEGFRWALLGHGSAPLAAIAVSAAVVLVVLTGGLYYFRRTELTFADMV
jgi:homopolymeric O-antigen transport system permease protein